MTQYEEIWSVILNNEHDTAKNALLGISVDYNQSNQYSVF